MRKFGEEQQRFGSNLDQINRLAMITVQLLQSNFSFIWSGFVKHGNQLNQDLIQKKKKEK